MDPSFISRRQGNDHGSTFLRHPTRAQPHEGNYKRISSSLHGCFGTTNIIPVHGRGTTLPPPCEVQNASDRDVRWNESHRDHLNTYNNQMELHRYQDPVRCRAFAITLKGPALVWLNKLSPSSISSFKELSIAFVSNLIRARKYKKTS